MAQKKKRKGVQPRKLIKPATPKPSTEYHPWRLCPAGQHWVKEHSLTVPRSAKNPDGEAKRRGHCRDSPSHRDQLYRDEMHEIVEKYFADLTGGPNDDSLGYDDGNRFDELIRGWTKYWNETLNPKDSLDPNLVKALIATESSFNPGKTNRRKGVNRAIGLMQVTNGTRKILSDEKGELKDRLVNLTENDAFNPILNIAAGVRWLYQKKKLATAKLRREATWEEAVAEYKSYLKDWIDFKRLPKGKRASKRQIAAAEQMEKLLLLYERLTK